MYKIFILLFLYPSLAISSNFTLDKFKIEINSNFLGEEIMLFGQKNIDDKVIIIFEGEKKNANKVFPPLDLLVTLTFAPLPRTHWPGM